VFCSERTEFLQRGVAATGVTGGVCDVQRVEESSREVASNDIVFGVLGCKIPKLLNDPIALPVLIALGNVGQRAEQAARQMITKLRVTRVLERQTAELR
jgi:hypothetical protein